MFRRYECIFEICTDNIYRVCSLYSFEGVKSPIEYVNYFGDYNGEVTPVPIPNTEVKLSSAEDTWLETTWENKSLPEFYQDSEFTAQGLVLVCPSLFAVKGSKLL